MPWYTKTPMPTARSSFATFVIGGIGYVVGGWTAVSLATNEAYNPATDTWSVKASLPTARSYVPGFVINDMGYVVGGWTSSGAINNTSAYDATTDTWSAKANMPTALSNHAAFVIGGIGYAVGGVVSGNPVATNQAYDPNTNTWSNKTSMPNARYNLGAFAVGSTGYAIGGFDYTQVFSKNQSYDPATNTWSNKADMPTARGAFATVVIGGFGYAVGGYNNTRLATNESYDPTTNSWSVKPSMPTARMHLRGFVIGSIGYAVGGYLGGNSYVATNEAFVIANMVSVSCSFTGRSIVSVSGGRQRRVAAQASGRSSVYARFAGRVALAVTMRGGSSVLVGSGRRRAVGAWAAGHSRCTVRTNARFSMAALIAGRSTLHAPAVRGRFTSIVLGGSTTIVIVPAPPPPELGPLRLIVVTGTEAVSVSPVLRCSVEWELNGVGSWSARLPVTAANVDRIDAGMEVRIVREGEGEIYRGRVSSRRIVLDGNEVVVELEGYSTAHELTWRTTELNWRVQSELGTAVSALLAGTGWTADIPSNVSGQLVSGEFQGVTLFEAVRALAQQVYHHVLPVPTERKIVFLRDASPSGLRVVLPTGPIWDVARDTLVMTRLRISRRDEDVVTQVIPVGAGEGPNQLTLRWSDRTAPYPIRVKTGPDGSPIYYLRDDDAVAQFGVRERVVAFKDVAPLANSETEIRRAANVLYDLAAAWLRQRAQPRVDWSAEVSGPLRMRDPLTGSWYLRPGNSVYLVARGVVEDWDGARTVVDLRTDAFVRGVKRTFENDAERVELDLTDTARVVRDDDLLADVVNRIWALSVAQKVAPAIDRHGPLRQSGDSGNPVVLDVVWDQNVRFLHKAILTITCRRVRSNVQTAAAGGGTTVTSSSGGGTTTTSAGGSGTITLTASGGAHQHDVARTQNLTAWSDPGYREQVVWADSSAGTGYGVYVGRDNTTPTNAILRMTVQGNHTHDVSGVLSGHTHSVTIPNHTHTVNIPSHTHDLVYGIYEAPYPSGLQISLRINGTNVTGALGGPWSPSQNATLRLDVTQFLQEPDGRPKQTANRVEVLTNNLVDIDVSLYAIVAIATIVPVGVV